MNYTTKSTNNTQANNTTITAKALTIYIYKNPIFKGCSNGGISEKYDTLLLLCPEGNTTIDLSNPPENLVKIVSRRLFGQRTYMHIEPYKAAEGVGWMAGGTIAYSSDSRFMSDYPLSVHDRDETQEAYDMLSR